MNAQGMKQTNRRPPKVHRRSSDVRTHDIIGILGDEYNLKILSATKDGSMSIDKMVQELDIPMISCYRRVKELEKNNLLQSKFIPSNSRKRKRAYSSNLKSYNIRYVNGKILTEIRYNNREEPDMYHVSSSSFYMD